MTQIRQDSTSKLLVGVKRYIKKVNAKQQVLFSRRGAVRENEIEIGRSEYTFKWYDNNRLSGEGRGRRGENTKSSPQESIEKEKEKNKLTRRVIMKRKRWRGGEGGNETDQTTVRINQGRGRKSI